MRKIISSMFISLDGVMQAPGGPEEDTAGGFKFGGWVAPYWDDVTDGAVSQVLSGTYDLLLGRKTYDIFASYWPNQTAESGPDIAITQGFNKAVKYVATRSTTPALPWDKSVSLGPDVVASLKALKAEDGPKLIVQGSGDLMQTLWTHGLVDELTTMTFPVVLGTGKRLFENGAAAGGLTLAASKVSPSGVVIATYTPGGAVQTGDFSQPPE